MRLCFGSFALTLLNNKKNNAVSKIFIGKELLNFIDPSYIIGKDDRYIYYFMDQERELPSELKFQLADRPELRECFLQFINRNMSSDHERIHHDLVSLIQDDEFLPDNAKEHLLRLSNELELPAFMAELFIFAVDSTHNKDGEVKPRRNRKRYNLMKEIQSTTDNEDMENLAKIAIEEQDIKALTFCLAKMNNNIYIKNVLIHLSRDINFPDHPEYTGLFHSTFSEMDRNNYRHKVIEGCLTEGYFSERPESLLATHMSEYTNNRYLYETLVFLHDHGLSDLCKQYEHLLTNKTYVRRLKEYITANAEK